jgi:hypothetical protein
MHRVLLGLTVFGAIGALAVPTAAAHGRDFTANPRAQIGQFATPPLIDPRFCHDRRSNDGDRRRSRCRTDVVMDWYGGEWALYNNRNWESDSYNDWWHDRPDRAYPRWVQHNRDCASDRMWWSGQGWHC